MIDDTLVTQGDTTSLREENSQNTEENSPHHENSELAAQLAPQESSQQKNFRMIREKAERVERERDELARRIKELESAPRHTPDEDINIAPDDLAEGKHISKVVQKMKRLENELNEYKKKSYAETTESRIRSEYPDFDKVVSRDNIESLKNSYPELAQTLNSSSDLYVTAKAAYTMIKKLGISPEDYQTEKEAVQRNMSKPRPMTSVSPQQGDSPLSKANAFANGLTDELKEQLRKEMFAARRGY